MNPVDFLLSSPIIYFIALSSSFTTGKVGNNFGKRHVNFIPEKLKFNVPAEILLNNLLMDVWFTRFKAYRK